MQNKNENKNKINRLFVVMLCMDRNLNYGKKGKEINFFWTVVL